MTPNCKSYSCSSENFILTWEAKYSKLLLRSIRKNLLSPSDAFDLGNDVELALTCVPPFEIDKLLLNITRSHALLYGKQGAVLVNLPVNANNSDLFWETTESVVSCSSYILDRNMFNSTKCQIVEAKWLQKSSSAGTEDAAYIALLLLSNGKIRVYNILVNATNYCFEISVPFDNGAFGLLRDDLVSIDSFDVFENSFSVISLTQNGDLYVLENIKYCETSGCRNKLLGPLRILPESDDNYGDNFVSVTTLAIESFTGLIMINVDGNVLHGVIVPANDSSEPTVEILEQIRLNNGTHTPSIKSFDMAEGVRQNIFVATEMLDTPTVYYYWSNMGAFVTHAKCFDILCREGALTEVEPDLSEQASSTTTCIVSCDSYGGAKQDSLLIGVIHIPGTHTLLCTSDALSTFRIDLQSYLPSFSTDIGLSTGNGTLEIGKHPKGNLTSAQPFLTVIQRMLSDCKRSPKVSLGSSNGSAAEVNAMSKKVVADLTQNRLNTLLAVNEQIKKRRALVIERLAHQVKEVEALSQLRDGLVSQTRELAEKYETLNSNQEVLESSAELLSRSIHACSSITSLNEETFYQKLLVMETELDKKRKLVSSLRRSSEQAFPMKTNSDIFDSEVTPNSARKYLVKNSILQKLVVQESTLINDLIAQINSLKACL